MKIIFNKGIPGFESLKRFDLKNLEGNDRFNILKAQKDGISFITTNPFEIYSDYEINLNEETIKELKIDKPEDVLVLSIITLGKTLEGSTINLQAPLVINIKNNLGKQYIIQNSQYKTKHPLIRREEDVSNY